jgi:IMP and pyridine-specific 5'-nucleotidase
MVPTVGSFFTPLRLTQAFKEYDACFHISRRKYIPPNFAELRHILNIAQVRAGSRRSCLRWLAAQFAQGS